MAATNGYIIYRCQTMTGCRITGSANDKLVRLAANYIMMDGFDIDCQNNTAGYIGTATGRDDVGFSAHHIWLLNSLVHGCKLSGLQWNNSEWYWIIHNTFYQNSSGWCGPWGSGLSVYNPEVIAGYTPTADDNAWTPFHIVIKYNIAHDNFNPQTGCTGNSDGNGIILDDWRHEQNAPNVSYTGGGLVMGNLAYHNGGKGIHSFGAEYVNDSEQHGV